MEDFTIEDCRFLVSEFGLDVKSTKKAVLLEALVRAGVSEFAMKEALKSKTDDIRTEPTFDKKDPVILVKMTRANPTFRFRGYKFTKEHPFVLMNEGDANDIVRFEVGFSMSNVEETETYYGSN